ncbi:hypothetical protein [Streptomyces barkulensis]|uniref:hypothetical protein n=1 Tax=Streptomyces barkulensis TaxID=1257026 RepID=UPI0023F9595C|nr:hypothetical protein [Streptomyces barkulensis]
MDVRAVVVRPPSGEPPHGTARAPRAPGSPRAGSARHRAAERRRRVRQGVTATAVAAALGIGGWLALSGGGEEGGGPAVPSQSEEDSP